MVKRRISLVLAIIMVIGMLLSFAGCAVLGVPEELRGNKVIYKYDELVKDEVSFSAFTMTYKGKTYLLTSIYTSYDAMSRYGSDARTFEATAINFSGEYKVVVDYRTDGSIINFSME